MTSVAEDEMESRHRFSIAGVILSVALIAGLGSFAGMRFAFQGNELVSGTSVTSWNDRLSDEQIRELANYGVRVASKDSPGVTTTPTQAASGATRAFGFLATKEVVVESVEMMEVSTSDGRISGQVLWVVYLDNVVQPNFGPPGSETDGKAGSMVVMIDPKSLEMVNALAF
jgi:hypothetical protein